MNESTKKKVQVVLGGTSGMGIAIAKELGTLGPVIVGGRSETKINATVAQLKQEGIDICGKTCDIGNLEDVKAFARAAADIAPIGNVINTAGAPYKGYSNEEIIRTNALGTAYVDEVFLQYMDGGVLINFASNTGQLFEISDEIKAVWDDPLAPDFVERCAKYVDSSYPAYKLSKSFVMYHTKANVTRFGKKGVRILSVSPGAYDTPMLNMLNTQDAIEAIAKGTALGRIGTSYEMARIVMAVLNPELGYLTGADITADGGKMAQVLIKQIS
ncbi:MAG: SDR family oxidoreductase [Clostridiales Family XIII bacterium]|nr:SDR family oxidoreductase [Clostridiales Family XIII bacterium]